MDSHEYAEKLKEIANYLQGKPQFETDGEPVISFWYWSDKEKFLAAVRAFGAGTKRYEGTGDSSYIYFDPSGLPEGVTLRICALRSVACHKVQEEKWECEPLLSQAEEAAISQ